jgi:hypothetical protein
MHCVMRPGPEGVQTLPQAPQLLTSDEMWVAQVPEEHVAKPAVQARHWFEPLQNWPSVQVPQFNVPPQPSGAVPQFSPSDAHVCGWQQVPEPRHTWPAAQVPQFSPFPHPSCADPHVLP